MGETRENDMLNPPSHPASGAPFEPKPSSASALHSAGMKVTPQRQAILSVLEGVDHPLSVQELSEQLGHPRPSHSTIYRNLERFNQEGWTESMIGPDQTMRFMRCRSGSHHHHIQCEKCGHVAELEICGIENYLTEADALCGFKLTRQYLQLFGLCPTCAVGSPSP